MTRGESHIERSPALLALAQCMVRLRLVREKRKPKVKPLGLFDEPGVVERNETMKRLLAASEEK